MTSIITLCLSIPLLSLLVQHCYAYYLLLQRSTVLHCYSHYLLLQVCNCCRYSFYKTYAHELSQCASDVQRNACPRDNLDALARKNCNLECDPACTP